MPASATARTISLLLTIAVAWTAAPRDASAQASATALSQRSDPAYLVLAPDRGFLGNEEVRDVLAAVRQQIPNTTLAFATAEKTSENLAGPLGALRAGDERREIVVLPLFMSTHEALYRKAADALAEEPAVTIAEPFGASYLAEEMLFDRIRSLTSGGRLDAGGHGGVVVEHGHAQHGTPVASGGGGAPHLILLADGAESAASADGIRADLEPLVRRAVHRFGLHGGEVAVLHDRLGDGGEQAFTSTIDGIREAADRNERVLLVPMNFGRRLTTMMSQWSWTTMALRGQSNIVEGDPDLTSHPNLERWLLRTAHAHGPLTRDEIGVIFVPHGSEYNWNETLREGLAPLRDDYVTEDAFSMVDPYVVERAVRKLEDRGMKAAMLVRIFSLESSFRDQAEYVLGLRREPPAGGHMGMPLERIESHLLFHTLGGVEAHPRFARALMERAREISTDPANETVLLLAHGTGADEDNERWMDNLRSIADYIREHTPTPYRDVRVHTWREDWPEKRAATIPEIRSMIEEANEDGGTALVVPVRTNDQGPARSLIPDLAFRYGYGFSPHPEFTAWVRDQIEEGIRVLTDTPKRGDPQAEQALPNQM